MEDRVVRLKPLSIEFENSQDATIANDDQRNNHGLIKE